MKILITEKQSKILKELSNISFDSRIWCDFLIKEIQKELDEKRKKRNSKNSEETNNEYLIINGKDYPAAYEKFPVDYFFINTDGIAAGYDENKSGLKDGKYYVFFNLSTGQLNPPVVNHELRHAYEDYNRIIRNRPSLSKSNEGNKYFSGDFEKLMTGQVGENFGIFKKVIEGLYYTSKIEESAYGETVYDMKFASPLLINQIKDLVNYDYKIVPAKYIKQMEKLWIKFKETIKIPILDKFKDYQSFLNWGDKIIKIRGRKVLNKLYKISYYRDHQEPVDEKKIPDLIPQNIVDAFYHRIETLLKTVDKNHPSVKREVDRILKINGNKIPNKIKKLLK